MKLVHPDILGPDSGDLQVGQTEWLGKEVIGGGSNLEGLIFVGKMKRNTAVFFFCLVFFIEVSQIVPTQIHPNSMR